MSGQDGNVLPALAVWRRKHDDLMPYNKTFIDHTQGKSEVNNKPTSRDKLACLLILVVSLLGYASA